MAAPISLSAFTFEGELLNSIKELVMDQIVQAPEFTLLHTLYPNIVEDKEIGFIGEGGLVGKANQGCDPTAHSFTIATRMLKWSPVDWDILIHACWTDLKATAASYSLKTGVNIPDFSTSDYMNIVVEVLVVAMKKFFIRLVWFNDTDADTVANGGILTAGTDKTYFNLLDGLWKQIDTQITSNPSQLVTITENAGGSYTLQALVKTNVQGYLESLVFGAPVTLRAMSDTAIFCTQSFYDGYAKSLAGTTISEMFEILQNGQKVLKYQGIPLIPIPVWDEIIAAYEDNGTTYNNPHRALYTSKSVLGVGLDSLNSFEDLQVWYDKDSRKVKIEAMGQADAKILNTDLFMVATGATGS
jgi:hypothetical protein